MFIKRDCKEEDIWRIRDFMQETYKKFDEKVNWHIDRLNFSYSMSRIMNDVSEKEYRRRIQLFEKDDQIISVVNTEGENRGEVFFQISSFNLDDQLISEMFDYAETITDEMHLRINANASKLISEAERRGYTKNSWSEITCVLAMDTTLEYDLDDCFYFGNPDTKSRALGHGMAFGYADKKNILDRAEDGLEVLKTMDDYNKLYDIHICNQEGQVVAFATVWFDRINKIGILEPVGTHPDYRKKGLAKAAIYEGCNRIFKEGATKVYVGSDQEFYKRIGFKIASEDLAFKYVKKC